MIRPARSGDAEPIAAIWNPIIRDTAITFTSHEKSDTALRAMIAERPGAFLVAETTGKVTGFATYGPFRSGPGYVRSGEHTILIAPSARGQGVGRALMAALEAQARQAGLHVLVGGVSSENPQAVAFHRAIGYSETGRMPEVARKFDRWMDLILLQKIL